MELTEEQEVTLEEHLARYRQSRPEHTARIEELEAQLEITQTGYRKLRPEHRAELGPGIKHLLRALKLEKALREKARDNPNFVHSIELFPIDFLRWSIWYATAEVSPQLKTTDQVRPRSKPNFVITCWHCAKQVSTTDKGLRYCSEECRTRNPINFALFDTFNLENA